MVHFTVLAKPDDINDAEGLIERSHFVKNGFSVFAATLPPVWFLVHRLWLELVIYLACLIGLVLLADFINPLILPLIHSAVTLYLGIEGNTLRLGALQRRGYVELAVVSGHDLEACEARFLSHCLERLQARRAEADKMSGNYPANRFDPVSGPNRRIASDDRIADGIIGLFPQPEAKG